VQKLVTDSVYLCLVRDNPEMLRFSLGVGSYQGYLVNESWITPTLAFSFCAVQPSRRPMYFSLCLCLRLKNTHDL